MPYGKHQSRGATHGAGSDYIAVVKNIHLVERLLTSWMPVHHGSAPEDDRCIGAGVLHLIGAANIALEHLNPWIVAGCSIKHAHRAPLTKQ